MDAGKNNFNGKNGQSPETELQEAVCLANARNIPEILATFIQAVTRIEKDFDINETDSNGGTALNFAVASEKFPLVEILIQNGANPNTRDVLGFTPFFYATGRFPNVKIARYLLEEGRADVTLRHKHGGTALHGAVFAGNHDCIKLLLKHGADPRWKGDDGKTLMDYARDDETKRLLHKAFRKADQKSDKSASHCAWCGVSPDSSSPQLKRCSQCRVSMYCSKRCQAKDWKQGKHKQNCAGFVVVKPRKGERFRTMMNWQNCPNINLYDHTYLEAPSSPFHTGKMIIVKVQVPIDPARLFLEEELADVGADVDRPLLIYNEDRTVFAEHNVHDRDYATLRRAAEKDGLWGLKAFFWAEVTDAPDGTFKVFPGKPAPFQQW